MGLLYRGAAARCLTIELLRTIIARSKHDALFCSKERIWMFLKMDNESMVDKNNVEAVCSIFLDGKSKKAMFLCQDRQRLFHPCYMAVTELNSPSRCSHSWHCKRRLTGEFGVIFLVMA